MAPGQPAYDRTHHCSSLKANMPALFVELSQSTGIEISID